MEHHLAMQACTRAATRTASGRQVMVHHGLWSNVPDLDGITQLANPDLRLGPAEGADIGAGRGVVPVLHHERRVPREAAPLLYMLLMGQDTGRATVGVRPVR